MAEMRLINIQKTYDDGTSVIKGVDLHIRDGEFMVFVGPSGCGKTTTLRMLAGLESISSGELRIGDRVVNDVPAAKRGVAMVFQSYALYPHMTVRENMAFGLKLAKRPLAEVNDAVERAAQALQITHLLDRKPKALSGGQRQRVAIGRAIVRKPDVFLFDEPLSNLDAALRVQMRIELARLHKELGTTMVYVTHDQVEAMTLGDRIAVFNGGRIEQVGTPLSLYERPANRFVAGFLGSPKMNFLPAALTRASEAGCEITLPGNVPFSLPLQVGTHADAQLTLGVRPEHLDWHGEAMPNAIPARVDLVEHLGGEQIIYASAAGVEGQLAVTLQGNATAPALSDAIWLKPRVEATYLFDSNGRALAPRPAP
ncbi:MAG: sn-glycerol-3-phosphate ABC transporter ATP-binding protein UgpC [Burkholderiales bacterium]|nr:sn-glycerol-3-phosphate ABC transporter ATP-binding protein UgpC [Burkholderiales bacterium]